jgi:hypothetical protein
MNSPKSLIQPEECALLLIDQQAGLAFGVASIDRQVLLNNVIALAKTATVFKLPVASGHSIDRASQYEYLGGRSSSKRRGEDAAAASAGFGDAH